MFPARDPRSPARGTWALVVSRAGAMANRRPPGPLPGALRGVDFPGPCIVGNVTLLLLITE